MAAFQQILVAILVISVMMSVGLDLTVERLSHVIKQPRVLAIGLVVGYVAVPGAAFAITRLCGADEGVVMGLLLVACTPGGPFGAMLAQRVDANLAAAASLLVTMTVLNTVMTPMIFRVLSTASGDLAIPIWPAVQLIVFYQLIPLAICVWIREKKPAFADKLVKRVTMLTNVAFTVLLVGMLVFRGSTAMAIGFKPLIIMEILVLATLAAGLLSFPLDLATRVGFALTHCIRAVGLALLLAGTWFDGDLSDRATVSIMGYSLLTFLNAIPLAWWYRRRQRRTEAQTATPTSPVTPQQA